MTEPKDYAALYLDGGDDPTFDQIDGFLHAHFGARAVHVNPDQSERDTLAALLFDAVVASKDDEDHPDFAYFLADRLIAAGVRVAPSPETPGLDVERLARAGYALKMMGHGSWETLDAYREWAEAIAREYAATPEEPKP